MNAVIYSKQGCFQCNEAKTFMRQNGIAFAEVVIGQDIIQEEFSQIYPNETSVPLIIIDGAKVGGYSDLKEWYNNRPQFLAE